MEEIMIPSSDSFDAHYHLAFEDIATDAVQSPRLIRIRLKLSKTDQFGRGADISGKHRQRLVPSYCSISLPGGTRWGGGSTVLLRQQCFLTRP